MRRAFAALLGCLALAGGPVIAGQACEQRPMTIERASAGLALAARVADAADASGAQVLLIARAGQDLSAYGLRWSHMGWLVRDAVRDSAREPGPEAPEGQPRPVWRVVHKLNHCGAADAALYRQGLAEFFMDDPHRYEAVLMPLAPALQPAMQALLRSDARAAALDEPRYNMLAYPWSQAYQQSNQWAIETLAMAAEPGVRDRVQAQAWLRLKGYQPTVLRLGPVTRLGARATRANIAFDDHPNAERFADRIATTTVDSVLDWLLASGLGGTPQRVR